MQGRLKGQTQEEVKAEGPSAEDDGERSQDESPSRNPRTKVHGEIEGGRNHGVVLRDRTR